MRITFIVSLLFIAVTKIGAAGDDGTFLAAVFEYYPIQNASLTPEERTSGNVKNYVDLLRSVDAPIDIAVFPEATITTGSSGSGRGGLLNVSPIVSSVDGSVVPCDDPDGFPAYFVELSCAARERNTYLVVNIVEKSVCSDDVSVDRTKCASDDFNMFNANVAFDRNGGIVARYRKFHLFGEYNMNVTQNVEITTFDTDFGVKFGTFICFDILFEEPPLWLVRDGVNYIIYPTMWFSEAPFLTALQVQNMWSVSTGAVLLAAGANNPFVGSGGSGIYDGRNGPKTLGIVGDGGSKIFISEVSKDPTKTKQEATVRRDDSDIDAIGATNDNFYLKTDKITGYNSYLINGNVDETYCYEEFCCDFKIDVETSPAVTKNRYRYRAFVYSGVRSFDGVYNGGIDVCAVAFCKDDTVESCGKRIFPYESIEWATTFKRITITGTFRVADSNFQYANTLLSSLEPLPRDSYEWSSVTNGDLATKTMKLVVPSGRLMTFGIYGRDFSRDSFPSVKKMVGVSYL